MAAFEKYALAFLYKELDEEISYLQELGQSFLKSDHEPEEETILKWPPSELLKLSVSKQVT